MRTKLHVVKNQSISVVIPSFNRQASTARAVRSVLSQDWPVNEIIVVDDASEPPLDAEDFADAANIRVLRLQTNQGAAAARQAGVNATSSDLVAFLDSDDIWLPGKLRSQMQSLAALAQSGLKPDTDLWVLSCGWRSVSEFENMLATRTPLATKHSNDFAAGCWFSPGSTLLAPRHAFARIGGFLPSLRRLEKITNGFCASGQPGGTCMSPPISAPRSTSAAVPRILRLGWRDLAFSNPARRVMIRQR